MTDRFDGIPSSGNADFSQIRPTSDLWTYLEAAGKPIVLYGMGNGADKIIEVLHTHHLEAADVFASDGFVRGQRFHDKVVLTFAQICEKYDEFIVLVSFGSRLPDVLERIYRLDEECELYIPDVPVAGGEIFDLAYFEKHYGDLYAAWQCMADEMSRRTFCDVVCYRLTGRLPYLRGHVVTPDSIYTDILSADTVRTAVDLGAYNGDSIRELMRYAPKLEEVIAFEPDERTFRKLNLWAESLKNIPDTDNLVADTNRLCLIPYHAAAWSEDTTLPFTAGGNRNSTAVTSDAVKAGAKIKTVTAMRLDSVKPKNPIDYIKYDVEGAEYEALCGSNEILLRDKPRLLVSLYHRSEDIWKFPLLLVKYGYRLYLRRQEYVPAWDLTLLCKSF